MLTRWIFSQFQIISLSLFGIFQFPFCPAPGLIFSMSDHAIKTSVRDVIFAPATFMGAGKLVEVRGRAVVVDLQINRVDMSANGAKIIVGVTETDPAALRGLREGAEVVVVGSVKKEQRRTFIEATSVEVLAAAAGAGVEESKGGGGGDGSCCPSAIEPERASSYGEGKGTVTMLQVEGGGGGGGGGSSSSSSSSDEPTSLLPVYEVGPVGCRSAVIIAYDIFGFGSHGNGSRIRLVSDQLAEKGWRVALPDFYRGDQWTMEKMAAQGRPGIGGFCKQFPWRAAGGGDGASGGGGSSGVGADLAAVLAHLKSQGVERVGIVGFCWGAWVTFKASSAAAGEGAGAASLPLEIACGVSVHPSITNEERFGGTDARLAEGIPPACPQLVLTAGNDRPNMQPGGAIIAGLQARGVRVDAHVYPDEKHGWVTRGDLANEATAIAVDDAMRRIVSFLAEHIPPSSQ